MKPTRLPLLITAILLPGCTDVIPPNPSTGNDAEAIPIVKAVAVDARPSKDHPQSFVEQILLPGAVVHGYETTPLLSKVAGYVEEIPYVVVTKEGASHLGTFVSSDERSVTIKRSDPDARRDFPWDAVDRNRTGYIDIGSRVEKGTPLAYLHIPEMVEEINQKEALLAQAKANVLQADADQGEKIAMKNFYKKDLANYDMLLVDQATTQELRDRAEAQYNAAEQAVKAAEQRVATAKAAVKVADANLAHSTALQDYATIKAPFTGLITKRMVDRGVFVRSATSNSGAMPLFEITRDDRVRIVANVPVTRAGRVDVGAKAIFHDIVGMPGVAIEGTVTHSASALDHGSFMLRIEVHLDNPAMDADLEYRDGQWLPRETRSEDEADRSIRLRPAMYGSLTIFHSWKTCSVLPKDAVGSYGGNDFVITLATGQGDEYTCKTSLIEVIHRDDDAKLVYFTRGPSRGAKVIAEGADRHRDAKKVKLAPPTP